MAEVDWEVNDVLTEAKMDAMSDQLVVTDTTAPTSPPEGMHWYDPDWGILRRWNGSAWKSYPNGLQQMADKVGTGIGYFIVGTEVDVNGADVSSFLQNGEQYCYEGEIAISANVDSTWFVFQAKLDGVDLGRQYPVKCEAPGSPAVPIESLFSFRIVFEVPSEAGYDLTMTVQRTVGSGGGAIPAAGDITLSHLGDFWQP